MNTPKAPPRRWVRYIMPFVIVALLLVMVRPTVFTPTVRAQESQPTNVSIPGTIQTPLGCPGDWQPECEATQLVYDAQDDLWSASFDLPAGSYEYKVAINNSWTENYGLNAVQDGPNILLVLEADTTVTFFYSHRTHWVTDSVNSIVANVPGSYQDEIGCPGEWQPDCLRSWLQDPDGDGVYTFETHVPAGDFEAKVALNQSWTINYGAEGAQDGPNIPFTVETEGSLVIFSFDTATNLLTITVDATQIGDVNPPAPTPEPTEPDEQTDLPPGQPGNVSIPGTIQPQIGCPGEWQPECEASQLTYSADDDLWMASFDLTAGSYEYKAAINNSWDENYGLNAVSFGPNIPLVVPEDMTVTFLYSHTTHWVTDSVNSIIANVPGSYQDEIGCPGEWQPDCLRSWLQDPDGDGVYAFGTSAIPAGDYEAKVAYNQSWDLNYGLGGEQNGPNIPFSVPEDGTYVEFFYDSQSHIMTIAIGGEAPSVGVVDTVGVRAHWVNRDTIAWDVGYAENVAYTLHYSATADMTVETGGIQGGESIALTYDPNGLSDEIKTRFPHLASFDAYKIGEADLEKVPDILKGQIFVQAMDDQGVVLDATALQIPGVLDDLYTYDGSLGVTFDGDVPTLSVWAPTAQSVKLHVFADANPDTASTVYDMVFDPAFGVWSVTGEAGWKNQFYLYEVQVFAPSTGKIENNLVTDPYSFSLALNSTRSQIVDLNDPALMPEGWNDVQKPPLERPEDIVLYELHIRDFSVNDASVPEEYRGTFKAFTVADSAGMTHLRNLASAGLTHLHLLPAFDIATINEDHSQWTGPSFEDLAAFPADSNEQQALINETRDQDGFNWGYDPFHYTVPEGSYSTDPNGSQRIIEFREMVMALNQAGLRVVMDVVYNHTNSSGQGEKSVLDRVVPGYYHRLNERGGVSRSTCCENTATENNMMRKLMVDSVLTWSTAYKVDGYRFDLMGHHMLSDMVAVRSALDSLTVEADGVDGTDIYVYGEGWDFGEVAGNARGTNATQLNIGGTGIGVFNDRIRDAVRGGSPFGGWQNQGFATGLYYDPNGITEGSEEEQFAQLLLFSDQVRIGLAGNLRDYSFIGADGATVTGADIDYNGLPAGYTLDPQENIVYVEAHDNQTFWDIMQYKVPAGTSLQDRVRVQNLGISIVMLSQGVPFFHAGMDMLRSKSFDKNSYNSGDWFNRLDYTYQTNNFGVGLPMAGDNETDWAVMSPLLADASITPGNAEITMAVSHFQEMLQIRRSSPLFRLETAEDVQQRLVFYNTGPDQIPGVIVMSLSDSGDVADIDPNYQQVVVIFNATAQELVYNEAALAGLALELHSVQVNSADAVVQGSSYAADGTFSVPARTTAVFVVPQ